jgi:hypothetical protein
MLNQTQAALFTAALAFEKPDESPYHKAARGGIKELTGKDRTATEWRDSVIGKP